MREIQAKSLILGPYHNYNVYRGCTHGCIYCDSRSLCYEIAPPFEDIVVKTNAPALAEKELSRRRQRIVCRSGSMADPYMPVEAERGLSRKVLEVILRYGHGAAFLTKNVLALRDLDLMAAIARKAVAIAAFTITTVDDDLAAKIEPFASRPSQRLLALRDFAREGIVTGVWMMPLLPWITANADNVRRIVDACADIGVRYIVGSSGMTLRDGSREHYYERLDALYPGLRRRYESRYGDAYMIPAPGADRLWAVFTDACDRRGVAWRENAIEAFFRIPVRSPQLSLFDGDSGENAR